jgi:hypothetical protein
MPKLRFQMPELRFQKENSVFALIYENFRLTAFEQISGQWTLNFDNMKHNSNNFFDAWSPVLIC